VFTPFASICPAVVTAESFVAFDVFDVFIEGTKKRTKKRGKRVLPVASPYLILETRLRA
jgi:hypothetical protein